MVCIHKQYYILQYNYYIPILNETPKRFRKAFSALLQRKEALNFRKYKIGLVVSFSSDSYPFLFSYEILLFKQH